MKKYVLAFLILMLSLPACAESSVNDWSEDWCQRHLSKAETLAAQPTKNPVKKVWRKIVLWDAKNAVKVQEALAPSVASAEELNRTPVGSNNVGVDYMLMQNIVNNAIRMNRPVYMPQTRYGVINGPHIGETYTYEYTQYVPY